MAEFHPPPTPQIPFYILKRKKAINFFKMKYINNYSKKGENGMMKYLV